jgi:asparagine synthase (glutamine-hydrolysing)
MSGIVGIVNLDRTLVDQALLHSMTQHLAFRGPDGQASWADSHVGFGHAMLRTDVQAVDSQQPCSLDGRVWITADARIDGREELTKRLEAKGCRELENASDAKLILHAYRIWGTSCVDYLLGDFVFAIWDAQRQRLFCARDHFGVRPFYYAHVGKCLIFSNNLDTIRLHPQVSDELNDLAIVNFLIFRYQPRIDQSTFADIQALLPAHTLVLEGGTPRTSRYWTLPIEEPIHYKRRDDYVHHFRELLDTAISDRMRTDRAGILMSGGMDSPSIAATVHHLRTRRGSKFELKAFTFVYDRLIPDNERHYAAVVAQHLDIPIHFEVQDDCKLFEEWDRNEFRFPEPVVSALWTNDNPVRKAALADKTSVFFSGYGPDALLNEPARYHTMLRHGLIGDAARQVCSFIRRYSDRPLAGAVQAWRRIWGVMEERRPAFEASKLLESRIVQKIGVPIRWWQLPYEPQRHPWRPSTYSSLANPFWTICFQQFDAANWLAPVEFRYPYFDIRLVRYLLRMPALPSFSNKMLLRKAMCDRLPESICLRPKSPLAGRPIHSYAEWVHQIKMPGNHLARYVDSDQVMRQWAQPNSVPGDTLKRSLISLNHWLENYKQNDKGARNETRTEH